MEYFGAKRLDRTASDMTTICAVREPGGTKM